MKYVTTAVALVAASLSVQAQYEPFRTLEHSVAYTIPSPAVLVALCEDGSMAKEMDVSSSKACEQKLLVAYSQIERYVSDESEIFERCDHSVDGFVHEVWECMEDLINKK